MRSLRFPHFWSCLTWGCIVTLDAMGTQKVLLIRFIAGADYILSLKSNHPTLFQQVEQWFQQMQADGSLPTVNTLSLDITASTRTVWTLSVDSFAALYQRRVGRTAKCHRGTDSSVMEQNHPRSAVLNSLPPQPQNCRCHSPALD